MRAPVILLAALALSGCDKLTGVADQKIADAEAVGFACRVAQKQPEACMKENEAQPPASLLDGWKSADEDIKAGKLDPGMSNVASEKKEGEPAAEGEHKPAEGEKPAEETPKDGEHKPAEDKKDAAAHGTEAGKKVTDEPKMIEIKPGHP